MAFYPNSSTLGADLNTTSTTQLFVLGTTMEGSDGTLWEYVQASTSVSAFAVVAISKGATIGMASVVDCVSGLQLAVSQVAFAASEFGWVPVRGNGGATSTMKVLCSSTMSGGNALYVGSRTGVVSIQASSTATVQGIIVYGASGTDHALTTSLPCVITWPQGRSAGT